MNQNKNLREEGDASVIKNKISIPLHDLQSAE